MDTLEVTAAVTLLASRTENTLGHTHKDALVTCARLLEQKNPTRDRAHTRPGERDERYLIDNVRLSRDVSPRVYSRN